jgi:hypothetical protein
MEKVISIRVLYSVKLNISEDTIKMLSEKDIKGLLILTSLNALLKEL